MADGYRSHREAFDEANYWRMTSAPRRKWKRLDPPRIEIRGTAAYGLRVSVCIAEVPGGGSVGIGLAQAYKSHAEALRAGREYVLKLKSGKDPSAIAQALWPVNP